MQDIIAITIAIAAGIWLVRSLWRQMLAPSCGQAANPGSPDGFVTLDELARTARIRERH